MFRVNHEVQDRGRGALLGLAAGDAVGAAVEFKRRGSFPPVTDMTGGGPHELNPGEWTDDTSMALCLGESLVECGGFDARDQMERYLLWWRGGYLSAKGECFDIGNTVARSLRWFEESGEPFCGSPDPKSAGNGSLMRLAPIPIRWWNKTIESIEMSAESSRTTHAAPTCMDGCRLFGAMLARAIQGLSKEEVLFGTIGCEELSDLCEEIAQIGQGGFAKKSEAQIIGNGYVVKSLEAALWAVHNAENYRQAVLAATNLGDDADTTAAIAGQLAGALWGEANIPGDWLEKLCGRTMIEELADRLLADST